MSAYQLNKLLYDLKDADKIKDLIADEQGLLSRYKLSGDEIQALRSENLDGLYHLGVNPYLIRIVFRSKYRY